MKMELRLNNILKNTTLKPMIDKIEKLISEKNYSQAYVEINNLIEYINQKFIYKNYNIKLDIASPFNAAKIYSDKDKALFEYMITLNNKNNTINLNKCSLNDIKYLSSIIESIYTYMINNYNEFI